MLAFRSWAWLSRRGPAGTGNPALLTTNGVSGAPANIISSGPQEGCFFGGTRTIDGTAPGTVVSLQVRVWATASGTSWETASPLARGESNVIQLSLGGGGFPTPNMIGLTFVPEPSSYALAGLGLLVTAFFGVHRRNR